MRVFSLQFSEFSTNFYAFYKIQPKVKHYLRTIFHRGPWKFLQIHNHTLTSHKTPQKNHRPCNVVPGHRPPAVRPNSGELAAGTGRARAEEDQRGLVARFRPEFEVVGAPAGLHGGGDRC
jgi:hypothetical protein